MAKIPAHLAAYAADGSWSNMTIGDYARRWAESDPDKVVYLGDPAAPTYASLLADGEALARALRDLGLGTGDVISFQVPNWIEASVINLAANLGGFVINPIVPIYRDAEVIQMLGDCGARAFFVAETFRGYDFAAMVDRVRPHLPQLQHIIFVRPAERTPDYAALVEHGRSLAAPLPKVDPDALKLILYTSGTTGRPKGVLHSHNTLDRVAQFGKRYSGVPNDVTLMPSPVTHISGFSGGLEKPFAVGSQVVLMEAWKAAEAVALIDRYGVTSTVAATPFLQELCDAADAAGSKLPTFRRFACGGAAVPSELVHTANRRLAHPCAYRVYGSSEVPLATPGILPEVSLEEAAETDGAALDYELRLVDDDGNEVPHGTDGEILVRGPAMFLGYADPQQTRESLTDDGFFRTGDIGRITPSSALVITGRKKDLIIRGGENISAKEIEDVLHLHPAIKEAAVVSMPHLRLGEGICAYLIPMGEEQPDMAALSAFVSEAGLAKQKCPERIEWVEAFPRTASGKIRKDMLRSMIKAQMEAEKAT
ncbi:MAG: AMP-binding protein [Novosphingobium sp.]|uniref:AMP-binding protein n=1 Tax=Novosphingobium sp. TaxID=1874826 RepID=UPI0030176F64